MQYVSTVITFHGKHRDVLLDSFKLPVDTTSVRAKNLYQCFDCGSVIQKDEEYTPFYYKPFEHSYKIRLCHACFPFLDKVIAELSSSLRRADYQKENVAHEIERISKALAARKIELLEQTKKVDPVQIEDIEAPRGDATGDGDAAR